MKFETKRILLPLGLTFLLLALFALFVLNIDAAESASEVSSSESETETQDPIYEANNVLLSNYYTELLDMKAKNADSSAGRQVNKYIDIYASKLNGLDDALLQYKDTANVIELYYNQGKAAADLAWIYYNYINLFADDNQAIAAINTVHTGSPAGWDNTQGGTPGGLQGLIGSTNKLEILNEKLYLTYQNDGIFARLYVAIFEERIANLQFDADSDAVRALASASLLSLKKCTGESAKRFEEIYDRTEKGILLQRYKDIASDSLRHIFSVVRPGEAPDDHSAVFGALFTINDSKTIELATVNDNLLKGLIALLEEEKQDKGAYTAVFFDTLCRELNAAEDKANQDQELFLPIPFFDDYELLCLRASAKDAITAHLEEKSYAADVRAVAIIDRYRVENGVLDKAPDMASVAFEEARACMQLDLYGEYLKTIADIESYGTDPTLSNDALAEYEAASKSVDAIDRNASKAEEDCISAYRNGQKQLEILRYDVKHSAIVDKASNAVGEEDRAELLEAIFDIAMLLPETQTYFEEKNVPDSLAEKYKLLTVARVTEILNKDDSFRREYSRRLIEKAELLSAQGRAEELPGLAAAADRIVKQAEAVERFLIQYDAVLASDAYDGLLSTSKTAIEMSAYDCIKAILDLTADSEDAFDNALSALEKQNQLTLAREEAYALINTAAADTAGVDANTKEAIKAIAEREKSAIAGLSDVESIAKRTEKALFEITKEKDISALEKRTDTILDSIGALDVLSEEDITVYQTQLDTYLSDISAHLWDMADKTAYNKALEDAYTYVEALLDKAVAQNEVEKQEKRELKKTELDQIHRETLEQIGSMTFLNAAERAPLLAQADVALQEGREAVDSAESSLEIDSAMQSAVADFAGIVSEGDRLCNIAGEEKKKDADAAMQIFAEQMRQRTLALQYLTEEEKQTAIAEIDSVLADFGEDLPFVWGLESLELTEKDAQVGMETVYQKAFDADLAVAKEQAKQMLSDADAEAREEMEGYWFHDENDLDKRKKEVGALLKAAFAELDGCKAPEEVHAVRDGALKQIEERRAADKNQENIRCVAALAPVMAALGVLCLVELCAAALLWLLCKKKALVSCALPVSVLMLASAAEKPMMPVPLAWILTVFLILADIFLAVVIVILLSKLWNSRVEKRPEAVFPKDGEEETALAAVDEPELPASKPARLGARVPFLRLGSPTTYPKIQPKAQLIYLLPPALPETVSAITVEQADLMLSDEDAFAAQETNIVNQEVYTGKRKATLNIDKIGRHFEAGELVSINTLKEKGLVKQNVGHVKILGRGVLDKPLNVVAQNFSASAIKMILLTGGSAILAEGSPERR